MDHTLWSIGRYFTMSCINKTKRKSVISQFYVVWKLYSKLILWSNTVFIVIFAIKYLFQIVILLCIKKMTFSMLRLSYWTLTMILKSPWLIFWLIWTDSQYYQIVFLRIRSRSVSILLLYTVLWATVTSCIYAFIIGPQTRSACICP